MVDDIQNWTASEHGLDSEEDKGYESDIHGGDCTAQDTAVDTENQDFNLTTENAIIDFDIQFHFFRVFWSYEYGLQILMHHFTSPVVFCYESKDFMEVRLR